MEEKIIKRLLTLSQQICIEEDTLADLSIKNLENSYIFDEHLEKLRTFLNQETIILNTLTKEKILDIQKTLLANSKLNDNEVAFNRLFIRIQDRLNEMEIKENKYHFEEEPKDDENELEIKPISQVNSQVSQANPNIDKITREAAISNNYYMPELNLEKYIIEVIDRIAIIVAKKIYDRINNTEASTKEEANFKKRLLKNLKQFKYDIFTLDYKLEKLGVQYRFNIDNIPYPEIIKEDITPICHNRCIDILDKLYTSDITTTDLEEISRLLFDLMSLEEYIEYLDEKSINNLIAFCKELEQMIETKNFGSYGLKKLQQKLKKY